VDASPVTATPTELHVVPAARIALGAFVHGAPADPDRLDAFARQIDRMPAFVAWYEAWGSNTAVTGKVVSVDRLRTVTERGATPMIVWEPWDPASGVDQPGYRLDVIARGDFDAYINSWAYQLAAYGGRVYLRFAHEMNAPWYPWSVTSNGNTTHDYVAAWRHIRSLFHAAGASNVRWVWSPDAGSHGAPPLAHFYPGDDHVDWVALDGYNWGDALPGATWRSFPEIFGEAYHALVGLTSKPVMIAEAASVEQGGDKAAWITRSLERLTSDFPAVRAICWFNEIKDDLDWAVDSSPTALAAFAAAAQAPSLDGRLP